MLKRSKAFLLAKMNLNGICTISRVESVVHLAGAVCQKKITSVSKHAYLCLINESRQLS